jgi:pyruvate kinase
VSKFRPSTPILAITSETKVASQLQLVWGVHPMLVDDAENATASFNHAMEMATQQALLKEGDLVIQTAGTVAGKSGSTDLVKVSIVGEGTVLDPAIM